MSRQIIAFITDFGNRDAYVGVMKSVIFAYGPSIKVIDLTHQIAPHDILSASYVLYSAWDYFPENTTFCAVVDPGVGSDRGVLLAELGGRYLVAPDNGIISLLVRMYPKTEAFTLETEMLAKLEAAAGTSAHPDYFSAARPSSTFHGRDIFAPAAAHCCLGRSDRIRGNRLDPLVDPKVYPKTDPAERTLHGHILHVDGFGNCISSLHHSDLTQLASTNPVITIPSRGFTTMSVHNTYAEVSVGAPLCLMGSSGFLEVAVREGNAAQQFGITGGLRIIVTGD